MSYQYVNVVTINKVAVIEFNYGRKLNALSKVFIDDLMQALSDLNRPEIRCIILRAPEWIQRSSPQATIFTNCPSGGRDPLSYDDPSASNHPHDPKISRNRSFRWWKVVFGVAHLK